MPVVQGRRIEAHLLLGMSITDITKADGVKKSSICGSIERGLEPQRVKKYCMTNLTSNFLFFHNLQIF